MFLYKVYYQPPHPPCVIQSWGWWTKRKHSRFYLSFDLRLLSLRRFFNIILTLPWHTEGLSKPLWRYLAIRIFNKMFPVKEKSYRFFSRIWNLQVLNFLANVYRKLQGIWFVVSLARSGNNTSRFFLFPTACNSYGWQFKIEPFVEEMLICWLAKFG